LLSVLILLLTGRPAWSRPEAPPACSNAAVQLHHDYSYLFGSADFSDADGDPESGSTYRWWINGVPTDSLPVAEGLLLHLEGSAAGANGEAPTLAQNPAYDAGKWGQALALPADGRLQFARPDNLSLDEGTIEMWVALRAAGDDPVYETSQTLLHYAVL